MFTSGFEVVVDVEVGTVVGSEVLLDADNEVKELLATVAGEVNEGAEELAKVMFAADNKLVEAMAGASEEFEDRSKISDFVDELFGIPVFSRVVSDAAVVVIVSDDPLIWLFASNVVKSSNSLFS